MRHKLIDRYRLMVFPVAVGGGKRLFRDGCDQTDLKLTDTKTTSTGVAMLTYEPGGAGAGGNGE
jgi:dihydrofolate reductase